MGRGRAPSYWWDFYWEDRTITAIIVETDADWVPNPVRTFPLTNNTSDDDLIEREVEPFIRDLKAGRIDPRRAGGHEISL